MTQSDDGEPRTELVRVPRPGGAPPMDGFLALPATTTNAEVPGVLVIHEAFGLNDNIRDVARRFARHNYAALAIDLFSGRNTALCLMRAFAGIMLRPLDNGTLVELRSALDVLKQRPEVDQSRIGVIGFCMGGSYALQLACVGDAVQAASTFYGQNPRPLTAFARACPIVGSFPQHDFTARGGRKLVEVLRRYEVPFDIKIYPNTRHSFFNERGALYDAAASDDAWRRTLAFFEQHLSAAAPTS